MQKRQEQENLMHMLRQYGKSKTERPKNMNFNVMISGPKLAASVQEREENILQEYEVLRLNQLQKQYDMYKDMIEGLFEENDQLIEKASNNFLCKNQKLLDALEPVVMGSISEFADDICESFIDDLLEESVRKTRYR